MVLLLQGTLPFHYLSAHWREAAFVPLIQMCSHAHIWAGDVQYFSTCPVWINVSPLQQGSTIRHISPSLKAALLLKKYKNIWVYGHVSNLSLSLRKGGVCALLV